MINDPKIYINNIHSVEAIVSIHRPHTGCGSEELLMRLNEDFRFTSIRLVTRTIKRDIKKLEKAVLSLLTDCNQPARNHYFFSVLSDSHNRE